jgi:GNAT superfamily N-acetyltransferase
MNGKKMLDEVRIRPVSPEEAEDLSDIAWRSKAYWEYPADTMKEFRDFLTITEDFLENNPSYLAEDEESEEKLGFYCLEVGEDGRWWLRHLWVAPEYIGTGIGGDLFLHACEMAETVGADELYILSDPNCEEFYLHMGAEKIGTTTLNVGRIKRTLPVLRIKLQ